MGDRASRDEASVLIPTDGGELSLLELQYTLTMFRGLYVRAYEASSAFPIDAMLSEDFAFDVAEFVARDLSHRVARYVFDAGLQELPVADDLNVIEINRENPISLLIAGVSIALTAAVILSGGKVRAGPLRIELPPIGEGIERLRRSFQPLSMGEVRDARRKRLK